MRCANDNRLHNGVVRFRDRAIAVIVILLIAAATGSFNVQATVQTNAQAGGAGPADHSIEGPGV